MRCEHCGSEDLAYERAALLVATPLRVEDEVLILGSSPHTAALDQVRIACRSCGRKQEGVRWEDWRPEQLPASKSVIDDEAAMNAIAAYINQPGECQGADSSNLSARCCPVPAARSSTMMAEGGGAPPQPLSRRRVVISSEFSGAETLSLSASPASHPVRCVLPALPQRGWPSIAGKALAGSSASSRA